VQRLMPSSRWGRRSTPPSPPIVRHGLDQGEFGSPRDSALLARRLEAAALTFLRAHRRDARVGDETDVGSNRLLTPGVQASAARAAVERACKGASRWHQAMLTSA
jgi:hypothetical protein